MGRYSPHETWTELMSHRELALARRHSREHERWTEHTHRLPPLRVGDHVYIQNLVGNHPRRWERTGTVVEVRQFHRYVVRVDGSGRVTLRNRQHLRQFTPLTSGTAAEPNTVAQQSRASSQDDPATARHPVAIGNPQAGDESITNIAFPSATNTSHTAQVTNCGFYTGREVPGSPKAELRLVRIPLVRVSSP